MEVRNPLEIPSPNVAAVPFRPSGFIPNQPYACIMGDNGNEVSSLQYRQLSFDFDLPRSESITSDMEIFYRSTFIRGTTGRVGTMELYISSKSSWIHLPISQPFEVLSMTLFLFAIKAGSMIPFYVPVNNDLKLDPNTNFIQTVYEDGPMKQWKIGRPIVRALTGSSIAVVKCFDDNGQVYSRIYYQDPELYLRERYYNNSTHQGVLGEQVPK
jgi:hypothetical protein